MIITFYSYKGGLGRTMAVANVATLLARDDKTVIAIDWDLEAPGLHRYFGLTDDQVGKGVIDYLYDYKELLSSDREITDAALPRVESYLRPVGEEQKEKRGNLYIMPAGRQDIFYTERVTRFDWLNFYEHWDGGRVIELLKQQLREKADYIVVDSRTGITDMGGICTVQLPDVLVLMFGTHSQSVDGIEGLADSILGHPLLRILGKELLILPVPSRIDDGVEYDLTKKWFELFRNRLRGCFESYVKIVHLAHFRHNWGHEQKTIPQ